MPAGLGARRAGDRAPDRARRRHGRSARATREAGAGGSTRRRSASAATACSATSARSTCRPPSASPTPRATASPPSTPRPAGSGCCSVTTSSSPRRRARSRSTAPRSCARCRPGRSTACTRRGGIRDDRQTRHFDLCDRARAVENQVFVVSANQTGRWGPLRFLGSAKVVDPDGAVLARTGAREGLARRRGRPRGGRTRSRIGHRPSRRPAPGRLRAAAARGDRARLRALTGRVRHRDHVRHRRGARRL